MCAVSVDKTVRSGRVYPELLSRRWLRRCMAMAFGLSTFIVVEAICIVFDWGNPVSYDDPYVDFSTVRPLFIRDAGGEHFEIAGARRKFFAPDSFPVRKEDTVFRIFCLGGSTVQGRPYSTPTSFPTWLELSLQTAAPDRAWEVINCGGVSYASYRLVPILEECLQHNADLIVVCTGHNEFLEDRTYEEIRETPAVFTIPLKWLSHSRSFCLFRESLHTFLKANREPAGQQRPILGTEVDALLDYENGLSVYHRDLERRERIIDHFEHNLRRMVRLANTAKVPIVLMRPPSNLRDCPPFKSEHRPNLSAAEKTEWDSLIQQAQEHYRTDLPRAVTLLERAAEIDDQYAFTFFELGKCRETLGHFEQARVAFRKARELDVCPLRIIEPLEESLTRVATEFNVPLLDAHRLLERECACGILGHGLLVDHIHPSPSRGHQLIATAIVEEMARMGWVDLSAGWFTRSQDAFRTHFASLENLYFLRGQRTLGDLQAWSHGRAKGPPIESRIPGALTQAAP